MNDKVSPSSLFDEHYYRHTGRMPLARRLSAMARRRVHRFFLQVMAPKPSDLILDVGTSDHTGHDANMLEQLYPHRNNLTCASLSDGTSISAAYPGVRHVQIAPGEPLPFKKNAFDIVFSNAVLEHVGSARHQKAFLGEICRIAPRRFVVVPNRLFPIETHTCIPLIHYLPKLWFRRLLRDGRYDFWSHEANLNYITATELQTLWPDYPPPKIAKAGIGIGFWKSNLVAYQSG